MKEGTSRWHLPRIPLYVCQAWIVCTVITLAVLYSEASAFKGLHRVGCCVSPSLRGPDRHASPPP